MLCPRCNTIPQASRAPDGAPPPPGCAVARAWPQHPSSALAVEELVDQDMAVLLPRAQYHRGEPGLVYGIREPLGLEAEPPVLGVHRPTLASQAAVGGKKVSRVKLDTGRCGQHSGGRVKGVGGARDSADAGS